MDRQEWGKANSGRRTKTCPRHGIYEGYPATKCPACKIEPQPDEAVMEGVLLLGDEKLQVKVLISKL